MHGFARLHDDLIAPHIGVGVEGFENLSLDAFF